MDQDKLKAITAGAIDLASKAQGTFHSHEVTGPIAAALVAKALEDEDPTSIAVALHNAAAQ